MLNWSCTLLLTALVAALFSYMPLTDGAGASQQIAQLVFLISGACGIALAIAAAIDGVALLVRRTAHRNPGRARVRGSQ